MTLAIGRHQLKRINLNLQNFKQFKLQASGFIKESICKGYQKKILVGIVS